MSKDGLIPFGKFGLTKPGDKFFAYITQSGREVMRASLDGGQTKWSATRYPTTDTIVETRTTKKR